MATRADYRNDLKDRLIGLEDSGYGDFEYSDSELDTYLELAVEALYPSLYRKIVEEDLPITEYGSYGLGAIAPTYPDRVYLVEDGRERDAIYGWEQRETQIVKLVASEHTTLNVYYTDSYSMPTDDVTAVSWPTVWRPLVVLGALVEALESRQDTGVRGDPGVGNQQLHEVSLLDRLYQRYERKRDELAMALPAMAL